MLSDIIGKTVKNDGKALKWLLEVYTVFSNFRHIGDYVFNVELPNGKLAVITTIPVDEDGTEILITDVNIRKNSEGGEGNVHDG